LLVLYVFLRNTYDQQKQDVRNLIKSKQAAESGLGPKVRTSMPKYY